MNISEYYSSTICRKNPEYRQIQKLLKDWKTENNITSKCVVHHRDDTEECIKYNNEHYERWGFNEDGTFEYGKYVIFMTNVEHAGYHHTCDKLSPETRAKMSSAKIGDKNPMYNKRHTDAARAKMSANNTLKGKHLPEETKAKMRAAHTGDKNPNYGKHLSEETKAKISAACRGKQLSAETKTKLRKVLSAKAAIYRVYKENGGPQNWNDFQATLKSGEITFEMQPISVFINGGK